MIHLKVLEHIINLGEGEVSGAWNWEGLLDTFSVKEVLLNYGLTGLWRLAWKSTSFLCIIVPTGNIYKIHEEISFSTYIKVQVMAIILLQIKF